MATDPPEITPDDILEAAKEPVQMTGEQGSHINRSMDELLKARAALEAEKSKGSPGFGIRIQKLRPGGCG